MEESDMAQGGTTGKRSRHPEALPSSHEQQQAPAPLSSHNNQDEDEDDWISHKSPRNPHRSSPSSPIVGPPSDGANNSEADSDNVEDVDEQKELPIAPNLRDFLAPGGHARFRPHPCWIGERRVAQPTAAAKDTEAPAASAVANPEAAAEDNAQQAPPIAAAEEQESEEEEDDQEDPDNSHPLDLLDIMARAQSRAMARAQASLQESTLTSPTERLLLKPPTFGKDWDSALHMAVRENATEAALVLIEAGAPVNAENARKVTPLILAAQKGNYAIVSALLKRGAHPGKDSSNGSTALLQAAHFGHLQVTQLLLAVGGPALLEQANYNHTTPLMRASQEGHLSTVQYLIAAGAQVNRRNRVYMTALMLASQRGHAEVCQLLIQQDAELDAVTNQNSTSLLLACKRGHVQVVKTLVTAGCELYVKDFRGRTARQVAQHRRHANAELLSLLDPAVQMDLMQQEGRVRRNFDIFKMWTLLQQDRARVIVEDDEQVGVDEINNVLQRPSLPYHLQEPRTTALLRILQLPAPLVQQITLYLPLPYQWSERLGILTRRSMVCANATVTAALDMMDEVLELGGFCQAADAAGLAAPLKEFSSWAAWRAWGLQHCTRTASPEQQVLNRQMGLARRDVTRTILPAPVVEVDCPPTICAWRRHAGFVQRIQAEPALRLVLLQRPFFMSDRLLASLQITSDLSSLIRRMDGATSIQLDPAVALDVVMLTSRLCSWYWEQPALAAQRSS